MKLPPGKRPLLTPRRPPDWGLPPVLGRRLLRPLRPRKPAAAPAQLPAAGSLAPAQAPGNLGG
ncbi:MAG: hypothetical protein WKG07_41125 [Hymenobacter sp.]